MLRRRPVVPILLLASHALASAPDLPAALLDPANDRVVARTVVPDAVRHVGEVRLLARGDATVVQTLLLTKALARVVAEIRKKEEGNWPADAPGHVEMARYLAALEAAAADVRSRPADGDERRLRLLIEFVADGRAAGVAFAGFDAADDDPIVPAARRPIAALGLERSYALRNMRLILADAFDLDDDELDRLGPLGPLAAAEARP